MSEIPPRLFQTGWRPTSSIGFQNSQRWGTVARWSQLADLVRNVTCTIVAFRRADWCRVLDYNCSHHHHHTTHFTGYVNFVVLLWDTLRIVRLMQSK
ncbi:hypothetical protein FOCC_FOCC008207 [Frankliniella occidentalis]|nr:hypothetical protein FOCC_FOCC008207 [Frankliniella occidentalis]